MIDSLHYQWHSFDNGRTIDKIVSEDGVVIRYEEYGDNARITISRNGNTAPFAITLGIYGWTFHISFYYKESDAQKAFDNIKPEIENIIELLPKSEEEYDKNSSTIGKVFHDFIDKVENIALNISNCLNRYHL